MESRSRITTALLLMRLSVFVVLLVWTVDKFLNPEHAAGVFEKFYKIGGMGSTALMIVGALELVLIIGFVIGYRKRITYGLVFLIHTVSTVSSWQQYLDPFSGPNLLFFAAIPMLAACWALYSLRDLDTRFTIA